MNCRISTSALILWIAGLCYCPSALPFDLTPLPTQGEILAAKKKYGIIFRLKFPIVEFGIHQFSTSVHEALTQLGHGCVGTIEECLDVNLDFANTGIIAGVRWNDDPPFRFKKGHGRYSSCPKKEKQSTISFALNMNCWLDHFKDVSAKADKNPDTYSTGYGTLLARTHFGDLQFLHAMAVKSGVQPRDTKAKLLMWAEFTWRVQSSGSDYIPPKTTTGAVSINGFQKHFPEREERTISNLFTLGRPWLRLQMGDIVFGSLLHMVEDSFAGGHVTRRPVPAQECNVPEIVEFHTYAGQDKKAHKDRDSLDDAKTKIALLEVLKELVHRRNERQSWAKIRPYLDKCVFRLATDATDSSAEIGK